MALKLREGDYVSDGSGGLLTVEGSEALLERVLWKLSVRRGSFPFLPELGSRLYLLGRESPVRRASAARQYVTEALADEPVTVTDVRLEGSRLRVELAREGGALTAELELGGLE